MLEILLEPLQYSFMQRSLLVAIIVGIISAVIGSYLMVQRLALLGDAISHSVLPGLAIAFCIGANIFIGAFIAGIISTILMNLIKTRSPIKEDAAMGIVLSAFFALGGDITDLKPQLLVNFSPKFKQIVIGFIPCF